MREAAARARVRHIAVQRSPAGLLTPALTSAPRVGVPRAVHSCAAMLFTPASMLRQGWSLSAAAQAWPSALLAHGAPPPVPSSLLEATRPHICGPGTPSCHPLTHLLSRPRACLLLDSLRMRERNKGLSSHTFCGSRLWTPPNLTESHSPPPPPLPPPCLGQVGKSGKRVKGALPPSSAAGPSGSQAGPNAVLQMGGRAFAPSMLNDVVRTFAPRHAQAPALAGAKSSMAQKIAVSSNSARQEQEDAQEFLQFLIDNVHEEIMGLRKDLSPGATAGAGLATASAGDEPPSSGGNAGSDPAPPEEWAQVGRKNRSAVTRQVGLPQGESSGGGGGGGAGSSSSQMSTIFRGAFKSVVKASSSKPSATIQPFTMLQLDIHSDSVHTLEAALQLSMTAESIGGCHQRFPSTDLMSFDRPESPSWCTILTSSDPTLSRPTQSTLRQMMQPHTGGHYTADVLQPDNTWLRFNDAVVEPVSEQTMLAEKPYIMFYQRQH
ncbi:MAG: hypothetical protein WDW38_000351 [Sanguina aurantia]